MRELRRAVEELGFVCGILKPFIEDFKRLGDTPFLADPGPWIDGTRFDQVGLSIDYEGSEQI